MDYVKNFKKLDNYLKSTDNIKRCEPFQIECSRFNEIAKKYLPLCKEKYSYYYSKINEFEYALNGKTIYRGFYCPSMIEDIVVGNCNRGKLLRNTIFNKKPTYVYGFDKEKNLIIVEHLHLGYYEFIEKNKNIFTGVVFNEFEDNQIIIEEISECVLNDDKKISEYTKVDFGYNEKVTELVKENYFYTNKKLESVDYYNYFKVFDLPQLEHTEYRFNHDEKGYLDSYTVEYVDGLQKEKQNKEEYKVHIKRKI